MIDKMTIETAYQDYLDGGTTENGGTCLTRAVDAALVNSSVPEKVVEKLAGQTVPLLESCELIISETYKENGTVLQKALDTSKSATEFVTGRRFFDVMAGLALERACVIVVWTRPHHVESLLVADAETNDSTDPNDHEWYLSDHYFAALSAGDEDSARQNLDDVWKEVMINKDGRKQVLVFPPEPNAVQEI